MLDTNKLKQPQTKQELPYKLHKMIIYTKNPHTSKIKILIALTFFSRFYYHNIFFKVYQ